MAENHRRTASHSGPARRRDSLEAAVVARRYYLDGKQKSEIAEEMGLSRYKVARLLDDAREQGIVRIEVDLPADVDLPLSERLRTAFGIGRVIVVRTIDSMPATNLSFLGRAAADYLTERVEADDVLGIAWGATLSAVVNAVTDLPACTVVQLVGGVHSVKLDINGVELTRQLAAKSLGESYPLHVPLVLSSSVAARELREDSGIARTLARYPDITVALLGIGSWPSGQSALYRELPETERDRILAAGAVADMCSIVLDERGRPVSDEALDRMMGISLEQLRTVREVIAVAGGAEKVTAIAAALRSSVIHTLITDDATARALLPR